MRTAPTLTDTGPTRSSDLRIATRAIVELRESHGFIPGEDGNCHAHDLVVRWWQLTHAPMPAHVLRDELRRYLFGDDCDHRDRHAVQRAADESLAVALLTGDVQLAPLPRRARR